MYPLQKSGYKILSHITKKSIGVSVLKAECVPLNEVVAIKTIEITSTRNQAEFQRLLDLTSMSQEDANILKHHCHFVEDQKLWVVMPYLVAGSIDSITSSLYPTGVPQEFVASVLKGLLKALAYFHSRFSCAHLGVKPGNILLDSDGVVKLSDFGVSSSNYGQEVLVKLESSTESSYLIEATPYWLPPEALGSGSGLSQKSDIWSVGVLALEMLFGGPPVYQTYLDGVYQTAPNYKKGVVHKKQGLCHRNMCPDLLKKFISLCLVQDQGERPTALLLLNHQFLVKENCWNQDYLTQNVLPHLRSTIEGRMARRVPVLEPIYNRPRFSKNGLHRAAFSGWTYVPERLLLKAELDIDGIPLDQPSWPPESDE